jgi:hypothetical protein
MTTTPNQWPPARLDDWNLVLWLASYAGRQAGYYPGLRKTRVAAEREAARRGLDWRRAIVATPDHRPSRRYAIDPRVVAGPDKAVAQ